MPCMLHGCVLAKAEHTHSAPHEGKRRARIKWLKYGFELDMKMLESGVNLVQSVRFLFCQLNRFVELKSRRLSPPPPPPPLLRHVEVESECNRKNAVYKWMWIVFCRKLCANGATLTSKTIMHRRVWISIVYLHRAWNRIYSIENKKKGMRT